MLKQRTDKIECIAPGNDLRFLAGVNSRYGQIDDAAGMGHGQKCDFRFKLKMMSSRKPIAEPRAPDQAEPALAVANAAASQHRRHGAIGPASQQWHAFRVGQAIPDNQIRLVPCVPKKLEIGRAMLAVAVEEEKPFDLTGDMGKGATQSSGLAVMRTGKRNNLGAGLGGEARGFVAAGIVDHTDGKTGAAASADDVSNSGSFVASRNENTRGRFFGRGIARQIAHTVALVKRTVRRPRAYKLD